MSLLLTEMHLFMHIIPGASENPPVMVHGPQKTSLARAPAYLEWGHSGERVAPRWKGSPSFLGPSALLARGTVAICPHSSIPEPLWGSQAKSS